MQPANDWESEGLYFLSVRPADESNDTVFLHHVPSNVATGQPDHELKVLTTDTKYGLPPSALQAAEGYLLQTNDARVLSATLLNNDIHYVQTTMDPENFSSGVYHGLIRGVGSDETISGNIISHATRDYAYPSITYSGLDGEQTHSMLMTFSHSGPYDFPGTSAVFHNRFGQLSPIYSEVVQVKKGDGLIDTQLPDTIERWGDYTDIQRKYNEAGVVWLCGSYGDSSERNNVWVAELKVENDLPIVDGIIAFPNPVYSAIRIAADFESDELVDLVLVDMKGAIVQRLEDQQVFKGPVEFNMYTHGLEHGQYILKISTQEGELLHSQKLILAP